MSSESDHSTREVSLLQAPVWEKATSFQPKFAEVHDLFTYKLDKYGGPYLQKFELTSHDYYTACLHSETELADCHIASPVMRGEGKNAHSMHNTPLPIFVAVRVRFRRSTCDELYCINNTQAPSHVAVSSGGLSLLTDNITSLHVALVELPNALPHASISIQTNYHETIYGEDTDDDDDNTENTHNNHYVVISRIDKLGRRVMFLTCYVLRDDYVCDDNKDDNNNNNNNNNREECIRALEQITNTQQLQEWLGTQRVLAMVHHVKAIISTSHAPSPAELSLTQSSTATSAKRGDEENEKEQTEE